MSDLKDVEIIDLDEVEEDDENENEEENEWTPDGINKETGEYDADHDAWYPNFKALADAEKEVLGHRTF